MPVAHEYFLTVEQIVKVDTADIVMVDTDAKLISDVVHVLFTNELVLDSEAATVLKHSVQVSGAHQMTMNVPVATFWSVNNGIVVMIMMVINVLSKMLNNDRIRGANLKAISLDALA